MVQVTYRYINRYVQDTLATNVYIAAFTTSNARLLLYDMLNKLGHSVAYCNTDSIVYIDNGVNTINPSAWGHLNLSSYCDVGRLFYGVFKLWSKLHRKK